eukprot:INCI19795.1.p1 GENE.INCI19795.1~~INCI19795.1.p1  ORF type:complete len:268 (-),score=54.81 INCI19795.1:295-1098(-)
MVAVQKRKLKLAKSAVQVMVPISAGQTAHWKLWTSDHKKFKVSVTFIPSTSPSQSPSPPSATASAAAAGAGADGSSVAAGADSASVKTPVLEPQKEHVLLAEQADIVGLAGRFAATHTGRIVLKVLDAERRFFSSTIANLRSCLVDSSVSKAEECVAFHHQLEGVLAGMDAETEATAGLASVRHALSKARTFHKGAFDAAVAFLQEEGVARWQAPERPLNPTAFFAGFLRDKVQPDTHCVREDLDSSYGQLATRVTRLGKSGELLSV